MANEKRWWMVELQNVDSGVTIKLSTEEIDTLRHAIQMAEEIPCEEYEIDQVVAKHLLYKFGNLCHSNIKGASE